MSSRTGDLSPRRGLVNKKRPLDFWGVSFLLEATVGIEPTHRGFAGLGRPRPVPSFTFSTITTKGHVSWRVVRRQVPYSSSSLSVNRHIE